MKRALSYAAVLLLVLAACGGGEPAAPTVVDEPASSQDDAPDPVEDTTEDAVEATEDTQDLLEAAEDANQAANAEAEGGTASITIDGDTIDVMSFEDSLIQRCDPDFFGGFWVILLSDPDPANQPDSVEMAFPGGDFTDPPRIRVVTNQGDVEWLADESDIPDGAPDPNIQWTVDGNTVTGSATLYEENSFFAFGAGQVDELLTAEATFEASCPAS